MKPNIHPTYYAEARVICSCGATWTTGSTVPEIRTDVCSTCHPFYTGEQRIVDTAGQVERFMKRLERRQSESARREIAMTARREAEEADDSERQADFPQPCRQRVEDEQEREPGREAERHHDQRRPLGVDGEGLAGRASRGSRRFDRCG